MHIAIDIPYGLTVDRLTPEPAAARSDLDRELAALVEDLYTDEELTRIFTAVVLLRQTTGTPLADCLATAAIWERG